MEPGENTYCLAFDTSQTQGQMLLLKNDKILHFLTWNKEGSHSELITLKFQELCDLISLKTQSKDRDSLKFPVDLKTSGIKTYEKFRIERIYCVCGPGSFTGCRVAVIFAKTLAYSLNCHVVPINSLDLLSLNCSDESRPVLSCIDARKNSVFASLYKKRKSVFKNKLLPIQKLDEFIKEEVSVCGEGLNRYKDFIPSSMRKYIKQEPQWGKTDLKKYFENPFFKENEKEISWIDLKPLYIKKSAAEEKQKELRQI